MRQTQGLDLGAQEAVALTLWEPMVSEVRVLDCRRVPLAVLLSSSLLSLGACSMLPQRLATLTGLSVRLVRCTRALSPGAT